MKVLLHSYVAAPSLQALTALVIEGRLIRAQGRGTFVASPRIEQQLTQLTGFTQDMRARGKRPSAQVLEASSISALPTVARSLKIKTGDTVIMLKRLRLADGEPVAIETAYLLETRCRGILREKLATRSLYEILTKKYNLKPVRAMQQMEAIACPAAEAELLGTRRGAPVLAFSRVVDKPLQLRCKIVSPDVVVVLDASLLLIQNPPADLKEDGIIVLNTPKSAAEIRQEGSATDSTEINVVVYR